MATSEQNLEPRVAKVETELEAVVRDIGALTNDVRSLTAIVRQQGENVEVQMRQLHVAVTSAAGPRKTEWGTLISAVGLILAIGASALSPLYLRVGDVQTGLSHTQSKLETHEKLHLHPVGESRIDALEVSLREASVRNAHGISELDAKLQKEYQLTDANIRERVGAVEREVRERWVIDATGLQKIQDGISLTRERLAVIEAEMRRSEKP